MSPEPPAIRTTAGWGDSVDEMVGKDAIEVDEFCCICNYLQLRMV
jgi:hypothetical protein